MILSVIGGDIEFQDARSIVLLSKIASSIPPPHVDGLIVVTSGYYYGYTQYIATKVKERAKPLLGRKYVLIGMPTWKDILNNKLLLKTESDVGYKLKFMQAQSGNVCQHKISDKIEFNVDRYKNEYGNSPIIAGGVYALDPSHDFQFCIDHSGSDIDVGNSVSFRANFEKHLERSFTHRDNDGNSLSINLPMAHLVIGGRHIQRELKLISQIAKDRRSIFVIFQGTGGIADLLARAKILYDAGDRELSRLQNKVYINEVTVSLLLRCVQQFKDRHASVMICDTASMEQAGNEAMEFILSPVKVINILSDHINLEKKDWHRPEAGLNNFSTSRELKNAISKGNFDVVSSMIEIGMITIDKAIFETFDFYKSGYIDAILIEQLLTRYQKQVSKFMLRGKAVALQTEAWMDYIDEGFRECFEEVSGVSIQKELNITYSSICKEEPFKHMFLWSCFRMDEKCSYAFMSKLQYPIIAAFFVYRAWIIYIYRRQKCLNGSSKQLSTWKEYARAFLKTSIETLDMCQKHLTTNEMQSLLNQPLKGWNGHSVMSILCKPCIFQVLPQVDDPITDVVTHEWYSNALNHYWSYGIPMRVLLRPHKLKKPEGMSSSRFYFNLAKLVFSSPRTKFLLNFISYFMFLILYSYFIIGDFQGLQNSTILTNSRNTARCDHERELCTSEIVLLIWIALLTVEEFRQVQNLPVERYKEKFMKWKSDIWNLLDVTGLMLFFLAFIVHAAGIRQSNPGLVGVARVFYCIDFLVLCPRSLQVLSIIPSQGPKLIMIYKLLADMVSFLFILFVILVAFGVSIQALRQPQYLPQNISSDTYIRDIFYIPFYNLAGEINQAQGDWSCNNVVGSYKEDCYIRRTLVNILMVIYALTTVILLLNLLIAILSKSYDVMDEEGVYLWRKQYNDIVAEYLTKPILVPPLNIFWIIYQLFRLFFCLMRGHKWAQSIDISSISKELGCGVELQWDDVSTERRPQIARYLMTVMKKSLTDLDLSERMELLQQTLENFRNNADDKLMTTLKEMDVTRLRINDQMLAVESSIINEVDKRSIDTNRLLNQLVYHGENARQRRHPSYDFEGIKDGPSARIEYEYPDENNDEVWSMIDIAKQSKAKRLASS
ncbi:Transient receptor potential cation channel subfamily M member 3 [Trichoplax sp. H2]|nr:Transient receptor potential cation channel subfamily M member 3 [Trichoplax sp. H2]|eukprot:RDD36732.1 Transient receptor potential cation channel subfamily M member 3 [Trichoplax sp. H2]